LLAVVASLRLAVALTVGWSVLRDGQVLSLLPLLPLRDFSALLIWVASLFGHEVIWRGDVFELKDGKLVRINS
jgi:ceramide glucosyltransferase